MPAIQVQLNGVQELLDKLNLTEDQIRQAQTLAVEKAAILLRDKTVEYAGAGHPGNPEVQSGRLRSSIRYVVQDEGTATAGYVGSDANYAAFVEFGHEQEPGRFVPALGKRLVASSVKEYPFLRPAIGEVFDGGLALASIEQTFQEELGL